MKIWAKCRHEDDGRERWAIITCCSLSRTQPEHDLLAGKRENSNPTRVGLKALWILKYKQASTHSCQNILGWGRWHIVCQIGPVVSEIFWFQWYMRLVCKKFRGWPSAAINACMHNILLNQANMHHHPVAWPCTNRKQRQHAHAQTAIRRHITEQ